MREFGGGGGGKRGGGRRGGKIGTNFPRCMCGNRFRKGEKEKKRGEKGRERETKRRRERDM